MRAGAAVILVVVLKHDVGLERGEGGLRRGFFWLRI